MFRRLFGGLLAWHSMAFGNDRATCGCTLIYVIGIKFLYNEHLELLL